MTFITADYIVEGRKQLSISDGEDLVFLQTGCRGIAGEVALECLPLSFRVSPLISLHLKEDQNI